MDVRVGLWRRHRAEELMLLNCVGEDSWESLGLQGDPTSPFWRRSAPGCSLEEMMLKLKLQYFGHLMRRVDSLEKTLMLGGIGGRRRRGQQRMRWLDSITDLMDVSLGELREMGCTGRPGVLQFMGSQRVGHDWGTELNWTEYLHKSTKFYSPLYDYPCLKFRRYIPVLEKVYIVFWPNYQSYFVFSSFPSPSHPAVFWI